jgi:hypothetical protein
MSQEFHRTAGNKIAGTQGFEVLVGGGTIDDPGSINDAERRRIFEGVVRAIWYGGYKVELEYGVLPAEYWALPPRPL